MTSINYKEKELKRLEKLCNISKIIWVITLILILFFVSVLGLKMLVMSSHIKKEKIEEVFY